MSSGQPLFVYGTLLYSDLLQRIVGRKVDGIPAQLDGYLRRTILGKRYPGLSPEPGGRVQGLLFEDLSMTELKRLDRYEGNEYVRKRISVNLGRQSRQCWAYLPRPGIKLSTESWNPAEGRSKGRRGR